MRETLPRERDTTGFNTLSNPSALYRLPGPALPEGVLSGALRAVSAPKSGHRMDVTYIATQMGLAGFGKFLSNHISLRKDRPQ